MSQTLTARNARKARWARRALLAGLSGPAEELVWVYAITDRLAPDQLSGLNGVGGERVRAVADTGLTAVVGSVDAEAFGENALAGLLSDLASVERVGRAHHQVIACVAAGGPVLPLRLATIYHDDDTVRELLVQRRAELTQMLDSFRDMEEWGVKVYLDPDTKGAGSVQAAAGGRHKAAGPLEDAPAGREPGPAGREHAAADPLAGLDGDGGGGDAWPDTLTGQERAWAGAEACAELIDRTLSGIAVASRRHPAPDPRFAGRAGWMVLNGAYLLPSGRAAEFAAVAKAVAGAHEGVRAALTGPWPPYSFADRQAIG